MKTDSDLIKIADAINVIVNKPDNTKSIIPDDQIALTNLIEEAGDQFFNLNANYLKIAAQNVNIDLILLLEKYYCVNQSDLDAACSTKFNQFLEAIASTKNKAALSLLERFLVGRDSDTDPLVKACINNDINLVRKLMPVYVSLHASGTSTIFVRCIKALKKSNDELFAIFRESKDFLAISNRVDISRDIPASIGEIILEIKAKKSSTLAPPEKEPEHLQRKDYSQLRRSPLETGRTYIDGYENDNLHGDDSIKSLGTNTKDEATQNFDANEYSDTDSDLDSDLDSDSDSDSEDDKTPDFTQPSDHFKYGIKAGLGVIVLLALSLCIADQARNKNMLSHTFNAITDWLWGTFCKQTSDATTASVVGMAILGGAVYGFISGGIGLMMNSAHQRSSSK